VQAPAGDVRVLGQVEGIELAERRERWLGLVISSRFARFQYASCAASDSVESATPSAPPALHAPEAALELGVGAAQGGAEIDLAVAREVRGDEQHVAQLVFQRLVAGAGLELGAQLLDFLVQLVEHRVHVRPVEAHARGALLQLHRALPFRQAARDSRQRAGVATLGMALDLLALLPVEQLLLGIAGVRRRLAPGGGVGLAVFVEHVRDAGATSCR
jgi:hypothetical protein